MHYLTEATGALCHPVDLGCSGHSCKWTARWNKKSETGGTHQSHSFHQATRSSTSLIVLNGLLFLPNSRMIDHKRSRIAS